MNASGDKTNVACMLSDVYIIHMAKTQAYNNIVIINLTLNILIGLISSCSNAFVIFVITKTETLRTSSYFLILGLAVWDFCGSVIALPALCTSQYYDLHNELLNYCVADFIFVFTTWLVTLNSFYLLCAVTVERFLAIKLHLRYNELVTVYRVCVVMVIIFVISVIGTLSRIFLPKVIFLSLVVIILIIILSIDFYCIYQICKVVRRHSALIHAQEQSTQPNINMPRYKKSVNTMYYVIGAFVLCYAPFTVSSVLSAIFEKRTQGMLHFAAVGVSTVFANGVLNPVIYCWKSTDLRRAAMVTLRRTLPQCFANSSGLRQSRSVSINMKHNSSRRT